MTDVDLVDALDRIVLAGVAFTARALGETGGPELTFPQWRVLVVLGEGTSGATLSEVAARIGVTLPATTRQLRRMERRGLVHIRRDEHDRRVARASLSADGTRIRASILDHRHEQIARALDDEALAATTSTALERIAAAFERFT